MMDSHTQNIRFPNATKPLVPPKPKIIPLPRARTHKTSTGTQVNLFRKSTKPQVLAKPVKISGSTDSGKVGSTSGSQKALNLDPETSESKTIIKKEQKVYIHKTEVRKTSHTTVIVKPQIAPKPILKSKPQTNVSFAAEHPPSNNKKGILKSVIRSNSAPVRKSNYTFLFPNQETAPFTSNKTSVNAITSSQNERLENSRNSERSSKREPPPPIVFTGWRKSRTFPIANAFQVPLCPSRNQSLINLQSIPDLQRPSRVHKKPLAEVNKVGIKPVKTNTTHSPSHKSDTIPVPPPRLKRKTSVLTPPNIAFDPPTKPVSLPIKTTPIYAKVNKNRKYAQRRNFRKNRNSIYNNENIEKTSLLLDSTLKKCEDDHEYEIIGDPNAEFNDELMDELKDLASEMVIKSKSSKHRAQTQQRKAEDKRKGGTEKPHLLPRTKTFFGDEIPEIPEMGGKDSKNPPELLQTESHSEELVDNKSFLFTIMPILPDDSAISNAQPPEILPYTLAEQTSEVKQPNSKENLEEMSMDKHPQDYSTKDDNSQVQASVLEDAHSEWEDISLGDPKSLEPELLKKSEKEVLVVSGKETPLVSEGSTPLLSEDTTPFLSEDTTPLVSEAELLAILNKIEPQISNPPQGEDAPSSAIPSTDNQVPCEVEVKVDFLSDDECDTVVAKTPDDLSTGGLEATKEKSKSKSSLLDFVDMEIQKVQHLLADIAGSSKRRKNSKSSLSPDVPKSALLRKSSVPNISSSLSEFQSANQIQDPQLSRRSWANKSTSSVTSSTSSSSLGSSYKTTAQGLVPQHGKGRRMSDVSEWFWADEGDTSTGVLGDNENSPLHSSTEEIGFVETSSGKPLFRRKRNVADFFGKARKSSLASFVNASMVWKNTGRRRSKCTEGHELPKIEVIFADNTSSTESKEGKVASFDEDDEEGDLQEMRKKAEAERTEKVLAGLSPKGKKAFYVVREILSSEQTFVDVLRLVTIEFPKSLERSGKRMKLKQGVISEPDLEFILGGLPILKGVNEDLLQDLEERVSGWEEGSQIADIFVKKGAFLKHYTNYIKDFEKISRFFDNVRQKNSNFAQAVREFEERKMCHSLGIKTYMLKPVQRMPQYALLLEDYLKNLDESHVDYEETKKAISIVRAVAEHANETIRVQAAWEQLILLQKRLPAVDFLSDNNGYLVKEGELLKVCRKELQPRYFVLMNDSLLCLTYINASAKDLKFKYKLPLTRMKITLTVSQEHQFEFSIIGIARSFNVVAKSCRERDEWMEAMTHAINVYNKRRPSFVPALDCAQKRYELGKQAPIWIQDSRVSMCQACATEFSMTFRRHHCRSCGKVVCRHCSANEAPLQYLDYEVGRVCDPCYEVILHDFEENYEDKESKAFCQIRQKFKKFNVGVTPPRKTVKGKRTVWLPSKIDEDNNTAAKLAGHLQWKEKKVWRRNWFVLIDNVLYIFAACEDVAAIKTLPVLGYTVEAGGSDDDSEKELGFKLKHKGRGVIAFQAENSRTAEKWVDALSEATTLKSP